MLTRRPCRCPPRWVPQFLWPLVSIAASLPGPRRPAPVPACRRIRIGRRRAPPCPASALTWLGIAGGSGSLRGREEQHSGLLHQRNHAQYTHGALEFAEVAAGEQRHGVSCPFPARRIHPVVAAGREGKYGQWVATVQYGLDDAAHRKATQIHRQHRHTGTGLFQRGGGLLGALHLSLDQFHVAELLFHFGQDFLSLVEVSGVCVPTAIGGAGCTGEQNADACLP